MSPQPDILITAGPYQFLAHFETAAAPKTVAAFRSVLPYKQKVGPALQGYLASHSPFPPSSAN